jgi:hypothetical protein
VQHVYGFLELRDVQHSVLTFRTLLDFPQLKARSLSRMVREVANSPAAVAANAAAWWSVQRALYPD